MLLSIRPDKEKLLNPPKLTSFSPTKGKAGTLVTLTGLNFTGTTAVTFASMPSVFTILSDTQIRATVPAGTGPSGFIRVTNFHDTVKSDSEFTIII
jgi:hypothetical protein